MYKQFTAEDHKKHFGFKFDYRVDGLMVYGTYQNYPFEQIEESLKRLGADYEINSLENDFFSQIREVKVFGKVFWLTVAYGGALLSEYIHLACLFGSKKNILLGSCGGLKKGASSMELIVPDWSYADESSAKAYQPDANNRYEADAELRSILAGRLSKKYTVHRGSTVTYQAMLAETWEDVVRWSNQGYVGVEMEAATVFAASKHFGVPAAAILRIGDNLIEEQTVMDVNYENTKDLRRQISQDSFDIVVEELLTLA
jgi:purine-nucleoside phosphorylase